MAISTAISLMAHHVFTWLLILAICAIPPATLGFISWWWVGGPLGVFALLGIIGGWRRHAARERAIQRARGEAA